MYGKIVSAALVGMSTVASAAPWDATYASGSGSYPSGGASYSSGTATSSYSASTGAISGYNPGSGYNSTSSSGQFPGGFPAPSDAELAQIQKDALGTLPTGNAPPPTPQEDSLISLGFIAFNELFEVAFFNELINNITSGAQGYTDIPNREQVLRVLKVALAQEELHELNANGAFQKFTGNTIQPCKYDFPVDNFMDAIALTSTFTDVVLATLPDIQTIFANQGDNGLIRGVGSVIGQEGEQNGFYHQILGQVPNQLPFLTGGARDFAFNAILQNFVVTDSCPNVDLLIASKNGKGVGLRTINTLKVLSDPSLFSIDADITAEFSFETSNAGVGNNFSAQQTGSGLYLTYINQQNAPFSVPIDEKAGEAGAQAFTASFPGKTHDLNGLTIAALTRTNGPFATPDDVANDTLFGPGLIEVNQKL